MKGTIINKFRGDVAILQPGLAMLEELTHVPVAGVVPYLDVDIEDEDSLFDHTGRKKGPALIDIAVIRLPRISNFTDFNALEQVEGVGVRYVKKARELGAPDLVILPGTKNTMGDLQWLRESGLEAAILKRAAGGTPVVGICGGYQMLGRTLRDPEGVEQGGAMRGMELLPVETVFEPQKVRTRVQGRVLCAQGLFAPLAGAGFDGYEIHMGRTVLSQGAQPLVHIEEAGGAAKADGAAWGNAMGCYVHGLFDSGDLGRRLVELLFARKGLDPAAVHTVDHKVYKEQQYDKLADALRSSLDMDLIYRIVEQGLEGAK